MLELTIKWLVFFQKSVLKQNPKDKHKKNLQLEPLGKKCFDLTEELGRKSNGLQVHRSTFGLTQTKKLCNERMRYHKS